MIRRNIEPVLRQLAQQYPIVTVVGPRQSGKTTPAKMVFRKNLMSRWKTQTTGVLPSKTRAAFWQPTKPAPRSTRFNVRPICPLTFRPWAPTLPPMSNAIYDSWLPCRTCG